MKDFTIFVYNEHNEYLMKCIKSICKQEYDLSKVQVIIGTLSLDKEIKQQIAGFGVDCEILEYEELSRALFYNDGVKRSAGNIFHFTDSYVLFSNPGTLKEVSKKIGVAGAVVCNMAYFGKGAPSGGAKYLLSSTVNGKVDVELEPFNININFQSYFVDGKRAKDFSFDPSFGVETGVKFIIDLLIKKPVYYNLGSIKLKSLVPFEDDPFNNAVQHNRDWYIPSLKNWISFAKDFKHIPIFVQEILVYLIHAKFSCNFNDRCKNVLNESQVDTFFGLVVELLKYIDDTAFFQTKVDVEHKHWLHSFRFSRELKFYLYKLKRGKDAFSFVSNDCILESQNNVITPLLRMLNERIDVHAINHKNGKLIFDCALSIEDYLDFDDFKIKIVYCGKEIPIKRTNIYNRICEFGRVVSERSTFQFEVDLSEGFGTLQAILNYGGKKCPLRFNFVKIQARLNNSKRSYWNGKGFTVRCGETKLLISRRQSCFKTAVSEACFIISKLKNEVEKKRVLKLCVLRVLYYLSKPFLKNRHIWISFDKLYKGGDNGEYIFRYAKEQGIRIYYILKKNTPDYNRLIKEYPKNILVFNSLKAKLYALHAQVILKTHANILGFLGFDGIARKMIAGLFNAEVMEIQHGITIQDIPQYQNRLVDNIKLYFIASPYEYNQLIQPSYGYDEDQLKMAGLARYDGLKDKSKKQILITPTWRHSITSPSLRHGTPREHNDVFKQSEYYKIYNSLITNDKLIKCAKKNGYEIIYLLHPTISAQIDDFDKDGFVKVIAAAGDMSYEEILTESSLMVTDYSGVQYDFAYMRKPLLYYHPDALPPHYDNGMMDYEKMGFGPICKTEKALVDELCGYMESGCKTEPEYCRRDEEFFAFDDHENCKRICDAVKDYLKTL